MLYDKERLEEYVQLVKEGKIERITMENEVVIIRSSSIDALQKRIEYLEELIDSQE